MALRMTGLTSGLDTESIVNAMMETHKAKKHKVESKKQKLEWKQEIWSGLNTKILNLYKGSLSKMRFSTGYTTKKATSSDSTKVTATAGTGAAKGTYTVNVKQVAASQYVTGGKVPKYTTTDENGNTETKSVSMSTKLSDIGMDVSNGGQIQVKSGDKTVSLVIDENTTVNDFVQSLKKAGLSASFDETQGRFFIGAKDSGADQGFTINYATTSSAMQSAVSDLKNAVGYDGLSDSQKKTVRELLNTMQKGTDKEVESAITSLQEMVEKNATTAVTNYYTNQIKNEYLSEYITTDADGNEKITDAGKAAIEEAGQMDDTFVESDMVAVAKKLADTNTTKKIKEDEYQDKIKDAVENGFSDADADISISSKADRDQSIADATNAYRAATVANGVTEVTGASDQLQKLGLNTVDGTAVSESESANGMVVIAGVDSEVVVNGATLTSKDSTLTVNGLTLNLTAVTNGDVSITVGDDTEAVYDSIKEMLSEYNSVLTEMNTLYNANSAKDYDVLTDDQKDEMSDDEVEKWNTKIKDSLLRRDSTLGDLRTTMRSIAGMTVTASNGKTYSLANLGITTSSDYKEYGLLHIKGDEDDSEYADSTNTLMNMLQEDPDTVAEVLSGITTKLYSSLTDKMKKTSLSSAMTFYNDVEMNKQISQYTKDIKEWETKLKDIEDRYYSQFTAMEKALSNLQSQQSSLSSYLGQ